MSLTKRKKTSLSKLAKDTEALGLHTFMGSVLRASDFMMREDATDSDLRNADEHLDQAESVAAPATAAKVSKIRDRLSRIRFR